MRILSTLLLLLLVFSVRTYAQEADEGCERRKIYFPQCDHSFADSVVDALNFEINVTGQSTIHALGRPDGKVLTLGCRGELIISFSDNALVDIPGDDLHVFEDGPKTEATLLAISSDITDANNWIEIGEISGATASIDIGPFVAREQTFTHVRLTDLGKACGGDYPGAEIDAVGAIGAAIREQLNSNVLFDYDSAILRPDGKTLLTAFAQSSDSKSISRIIITGHTSSEGTEAYNLTLSRERANAVHAFLGARPEFNNLEMLSNGLGEGQSDQQVVMAEDRRVDIWMVRAN